MNASRLLPLAASLVLLLAAAPGCASGGAAQRDAERLALYAANAGEPVTSIRYFGRLSGWTPLGDDALALWTRPGEAYLLKLDRCPDLPYAFAITVSEQSGRIYSRFDRVVVLDRTSSIRIPCRIQDIRPLDVKAIRAAEKERRDAGDVPAESRPADAAQPAGGT